MHKANFHVFLWIFSFLIIFPLFSQNIQKDTVYTLKADEKVAYEENSLGMYQSQAGYLVVTSNDEKSHKFQRYYHLKEGVFGPYNRKKIEKPAFNEYIWGFIDGQGTNSEVVINGEIVGKYASAQYPLGLQVAGSSWIYALYYVKENTFDLLYNGNKLGNYATLIDYKLAENGSMAAVIFANERKQEFLQLSKGQIFGPYQKIYDFHFLGREGNFWVMSVAKNTIDEFFTVITQEREIGTFKMLAGRGNPTKKPILKTFGYNYGITILKEDKIYYLANDFLYGPYQDVPENINMGYDFNRFNYIIGEKRNFYFKGEPNYTQNVRNYFVSNTRKSVALIKPASERKDSLLINQREFKGIYNEIVYVSFEPEGEKWALLSKEAINRYSIHLEGKQPFNFFSVDAKRTEPVLLLSPEAKHWAFAYWDSFTGKPKLFIDEQDFSEGFLGNLKLLRKGSQYYFSWFEQEGNTVFFCTMLLD